MCDCALAVNAERGDIESVVADIERTLAGRPMVVENYDIVTHDRVSRAVGLEVGALWIASVIAGIAALLVTTQAVARHIGGRRRSTTALSAIGATRPELARAWILILVPVAVIGAGGAVAVSIALSPLFPRGLARRAEPDLGVARRCAGRGARRAGRRADRAGHRCDRRIDDVREAERSAIGVDTGPDGGMGIGPAPAGNARGEHGRRSGA